jgi:hypothetical protein
MPELELTRSRDDRRRYEIDGVGALRLEGFFSYKASVEADGATWTFRRVGFWRRAVEATDASDMVVGAFEPRTLRRGGTLTWRGRELELRPASAWKERYALVDSDREIAVVDGKSWGKRPVRITVDDPAAVEPGLLLFAAFVVRGLAEDADAAAGAVVASSSATSG